MPRSRGSLKESTSADWRPIARSAMRIGIFDHALKSPQLPYPGSCNEVLFTEIIYNSSPRNRISSAQC